MSDAVLINQIIASLGLSGKAAEDKRHELEKLSNDELNKLLTNSSTFGKTELGSFVTLDAKFPKVLAGQVNTLDGGLQVFGSSIIDDNFGLNLSSSSSSSPKKYSRTQERELDKFLGDFLYDSATSGLSDVSDYNKSVGWFNITDRAVNGFKVLTGQEDRFDLQDRLTEEQKAAKALKDAAQNKPASFESQIERKYNIPYSHENVEKLKTASEEYTRVTAYHDKAARLNDGLDEIRGIIRKENEYEQAKKYVKGASAASLTPPEISAHEKFGTVLLEFCNGDKELVDKYMANLSKNVQINSGSKEEINKNFDKILTALQADCQNEYKKALGSKSYAQYESEYNNACKKVIGSKDSAQVAKDYIETAKTSAAYTEIGLTIATSLLAPGSSVVKGAMTKAAVKYGEKAAMNTMKGVMTFGMGSMPAALGTLNAATSESGFTPEAKAEIFEKFKSGMIYGGFGAYASGPLGNAVESFLKAKPTAFSSAVSKVFTSQGVSAAAKTAGVTAETTADILFDRLTSDLDFQESLKENGLMNFGMMFAGGRLSGAMKENLQNMKIEQAADGSYSVKDKTGEKIFKSADKNALAGFVISGAKKFADGSQAKLFKKSASVKDTAASEVKTASKPENNVTTPVKATEDDLKEIHKIDMEAFNETDTVDADFEAYKNAMKEDGLTNYVLKDKNGKLSGYYTLEPVEDGCLYINSIGVPKESRNTRTSYDALKQMQEQIAQIAKNEGVTTVALHVDAENKNLVKLYKKFGFEIKNTEPGYFKNGNDAHYMEIDLKKTPDSETKISSAVEVSVKAESDPVSTEPVMEKNLYSYSQKIEKSGHIAEFFKPTSDAQKGAASMADEIADPYSYVLEGPKIEAVKIEVGNEPGAELIYKINKSEDKSSLDLCIGFDPSLKDADIIDAAYKEIDESISSIVNKNNISSIRIEADPSDVRLVEYLKSQGYEPKETLDGYYKDGSPSVVYEAGDMKYKQTVAKFKDKNYDSKFISDEHRKTFIDFCKNDSYDSFIVNKLALYDNAKNKEMFNKENIDCLENLLKEYKFTGVSVENKLNFLSNAENAEELKEIMRLKSELNTLAESKAVDSSGVLYGGYTKDAVLAQIEAVEKIDSFNSVEILSSVLSNIDSHDQLEGIFFVENAKKNEIKQLLERSTNDSRAEIKRKDDIRFAYIDYMLANITSKAVAQAKLDMDVKMTEMGFPEAEKYQLLGGNYRICNDPKFNELFNDYYNRYKDCHEFKGEELLGILSMSKNGADLKLRMETIDKLMQPGVNGVDVYKKMYFPKDGGYAPTDGFTDNVHKLMQGYTDFDLKNLPSVNGREKLWYGAQSRPEAINLSLTNLKELKANKNIPESLKMYLYANYKDIAAIEGAAAEIVKSVPPEKLNRLADSGLLKYCQSIEAIKNTASREDIDFAFIEKHKLYRLIQDVQTDLNKIRQFEPEKVDKLTQYGLNERCHSIEDVNDYCSIKMSCFDNIQNRSLTGRDNAVGKELSIKEQAALANLEEDQWNRFLNRKLNDTNNIFSKKIGVVQSAKLAMLDDAKYKEFEDLVGYLKENKDKLQQQDMADLTDSEIGGMVLDNISGASSLMQISGAGVLRHAVALKYDGYKTFLNQAGNLDNLEPQMRDFISKQLDALPHPEQKIEKLQILSAIKPNVDTETLTGLVTAIKSPEMTKEQKLLADKIFSTEKPYTAQIEDFMREFRVPENQQDELRNFLKEQNFNQKFVTPPSAQEQIDIIKKKIGSIVSNDKIPEDKKSSYLALLNSQIEEIKAEPERFTASRINDRAMKPLEQKVEAYINLPNGRAEFNAKVNKSLYDRINVETTPELLSSITYDSKYFAKLFPGIANEGFKKQYLNLIELVKQNPGKPLSKIAASLPHNIETKALFEKNGLDYERWTRFDENSSKPFTVKVDVQSAVDAQRKNLLEELGSDSVKKLDSAQVQRLNQILADGNIDTAGQKELPQIIRAIEKELETNKYWAQDTPDIKMFKDHIKIHKKNIMSVEKLKNSTEELNVRLWNNDDTGRNIFFGNHVGCCTSVGNSNSFAAPQHLLNSFVNGIEIVDKAGNSMGNSMCYFAKVDDKMTFIIDSFEANGKLGASKGVTDAIIDYAKQVCKEMGQPQANIMFGPNFNKLNFERCIKTPNHRIEVIGRTSESTYIDSTGPVINETVFGKKMHEIMDL